MKKLLLPLFVLAFLAGGCEKIADCPDCIYEKVIDFSKDHICNDGSSGVAEYLFQGQFVYVFSDGTCGADMGATVYSSECEKIGFLGGFTGNLIINDVVFYENAVFKRNIWHD